MTKACKVTTIKLGDTDVTWPLTGADLPNASGVEAFVRDTSDGTTVSPVATVTDAVRGEVTLATGALAVGLYQVEFKVTYPGPKDYRWPLSGYILLSVEQNLG